MTDHPERRANDHLHPELAEPIGQIVDILEGPEVKQLGGPPVRADGLVDTVNTIKTEVGTIKSEVNTIKLEQENLATSGVKVNFTWLTKVAVFLLTVVNIGAGIANVAEALKG